MTEDRAFWDQLGPQIDWLHRQLRRLGVHEADLDDVAQDLLIAVHRRWRDYDHSRPIRAWTFAFAIRVAADYRKRQARRSQAVPLFEDLPDHADGPMEHLAVAAKRALLLRAMEALDLSKRAIITLVDLEEMTVPEAVAILEIPLNTGYSRLRVARAELAEAVRALAEENP